MYYTTQVPKQVSRQFDDEVILANFVTGIYYSLAGTAADIWLGIQSGKSVQEIVTAFVTLGPESAENTAQSITTFIKGLLSEKIIMPHGGVPNPQPCAPQFSSSFAQPILERFDDLCDLLFLDPVHDVNDAGWPMQAPKDDL